MTQEEWREHEAFLDVSGSFDDNSGGYEGDILRGTTAAEISHAGEAIQDPEEDRADEDLLEMLREQQSKIFSCRPRDRCMRADRTQILVDTFAAQLESMANAYMTWDLGMSEKDLGDEYTLLEGAVIEETRQVMVVDLFARWREVPIAEGDVFVASTYVRQGLMPSTPHHASVVITVRALELFRLFQLRCPHLGIQSFVHGLCDLHGVAPRPYLGAQFSTAFDVYLSIRAEVAKRIQAVLGRDVPNWCLKSTCPACIYKLEGEPKLTLPIVATQDRNNSLKRFHRREREYLLDGTAIPGASKERRDNRQVPGDHYLSRSDVDEWAKDETDEVMRGFQSGVAEGEDEGAGCDECWENMKEAVTARAWGIYDETGIFPALCRHGFVLVVVDMVQSGELAKYGLAVINHLIRVLGEVTMGIDVGCKTGRMVKAHPRLSELALQNNFKAVVGAFHGLRHGRLCSVCHMSMYVNGMGLEDCKNCESYFSKSNALVSSTRYSTVFHRQQAITTYMQHTDVCDAYQGLMLIIGNKYWRALKIKQGLPALQEAMQSLNVPTHDVFETWLEKEKEYLRSMKKEPLEETLEMEYYEKLEQERLRSTRGVNTPFIPAETDASYAESVKQTRCIETQRRHTSEIFSKRLDAMQDLEQRLGITTRWVAGSEEWKNAAKLGLIVARLFELSKMNMSGTGYKLRKHIAKALQVRSKAVKTALQKYNATTAAMDPPKTHLTWETALPAGHATMDQHFKIWRADEEIERLNMEMCRLMTYMGDEQDFLVHHEQRLQEEGNGALALQVRRHRVERGHFDDGHVEQLWKLAKVPGFTGNLSRGVAVSTERQVPGGASSGSEEHLGAGDMRNNALNEEDEEDEGDMDAIVDVFKNIIHIAHNVETAA
ncbi:hypothetical protein B0H14DRAFT_2557314 [Mycena olivaceomarginata]|nr:hypothetical protein B0H14DRAFT_2557314 [Mycena olivaceomarginata]